MSVDTAAAVLAGLIFFAGVGLIMLYKNGKKLQVRIVDRED